MIAMTAIVTTATEPDLLQDQTKKTNHVLCAAGQGFQSTSRLMMTFFKEFVMHDSRGASLKIGDRVLIEAKVTELCEGADPNYCNVRVQVVTPDQRDGTPMTPPTIDAINTKMLKVGVCFYAET